MVASLNCLSEQNLIYSVFGWQGRGVQTIKNVSPPVDNFYALIPTVFMFWMELLLGSG